MRSSYIEQTVRHLVKSGGDVIKFVGDAIIALWPPDRGGDGGALGTESDVDSAGTSDEQLALLCRRALQAALAVQAHLGSVELAHGARFRIKIGLGVGNVTISHIGGVPDGVVDKRLEYVATGEPLIQAFACEGDASAGDVVASPEVWALVAPYFEGRPVGTDR